MIIIEKLPLVIILGLNLVAWLLMGYDKRQAGSRGWRVSEKTLLLVSLVGGAPGIYLGMKIFRHKTRRALFTVGVPFLIFFNLVVLGLVINIM